MNKQIIKKWFWGEFSLKRVATSILAIYIIVGVWAYFRSDHLIFLPREASYEKTDEFYLLKTAQGIEIAVLYLPNPTANYTILYSHGNAEDLGDIRPRMENLQDMGFSVLAYDYPGYGISEGRPSVSGAYEAINAAYGYLRETLQVQPHQIIVYGRSVGSGPSTDLASRQSVGGLVIESGFTSTFRVVTRIPLYPFDHFPNLANIQNVEVPVLVLHGTRDRLIPFSHGQQLYTAIDGPKLSFWVEGAGHNNLLDIAGDRYRETLIKFQEML